MELPKGWYTVNYNLQGANPHQLHLSFTPQPSASSPLKVSLSPQHKRSSKSIHFIAGGTYNLSLTQSTSNRDEADIEFLSIRRHPPFILALYIIARFTKFVIKNKGRPLYQFPLKKRIAYIKNVLNPKEENTLSPKQQFPQTYSSWRDRNEAHLTSDYFIRQQYEWSPTLSILMPVYNTKPALLKEAIDSIKAQYYKNWQLCIADDASTDPEIGEILEQYAATDPRIKVRYRSENGHIAECSNTALELIESDFTILMDHDDLIPPYALNYITNCLNETPDLDFIYSDQDLINESGDRSSPMFKPQFSPDLFYSQNYLNHLTVLRTQKLRDIGGWKTGYEGAQDYDLYLRYLHNIPHQKIKHIPVILYHWRITEGSTAMSINEKDYAVEAGKRALQDYFNQHYSNCEVSILPNLPYYRIKRPLPKSKPLVSIIIPTKDHYETLKACIESVKEKTLYPNYEIIVIDNDSSEDSTLDYLQVLSESEKITVLTHNKPFNYSSINNEAVRHANGEILCFMNNDIEIISEGWLEEMVSQAIRPEIGCVGAKLLYHDDTIQHSGVLLGLGGYAAHAHRGMNQSDFGYYGRIHLIQNYSAVTAALLVVRKEVFAKAKGFEEEHLKVAYNDVDLCLKIYQLGYLNLYTPYALAYHYESKSRGEDSHTAEKIERLNQEKNYLFNTWRSMIENDPFYSPNLTRSREDFSID